MSLQDAHKEVGAAKGAKGRRRKYGPFETKHTVTSVVFLHSEYLLATAGEQFFYTLRSPIQLQQSPVPLLLAKQYVSKKTVPKIAPQL